MDPLTAISLAGNIVQFVDFSCKLVSETRRVYKSATGLPQNAIALDIVVADVEKMMEGLQITSRSGTTEAGLLLRSLAFDCTAVGKELRAAIDMMKKDSSNKIWRSFKAALQHVLRPEQVRRIASEVAQLQRQVGLQLLILMSAQQHELTVKLGEIEDNDRRLGLLRTIQFQQLKGSLLRSIHGLQEGQNLQGSSIKTHLDRISGLQDCVQSDVSALSGRMGELRDALQAFGSETHDIAVEQNVLASLAYEDAHVRREQVGTGHSDTFGWIFDTNFTAGPTSSQTFADWLRSDAGLCWIAGKPGSGKSTLMKRILTESRTQQELREWASKTQHELCTGSYFFWIAGTPLQKSQEGLLRSLLYDVFRQGPQAISRACCNRRLKCSNPYRGSIREPWTRSELLETLVALADNKDIGKKYCFFIDGLDEYKAPEEGDYDDLVKLLQRLSACPNFKFVVASREENEFRDHYLTVNHYILQQLTKNDIENLVHSLFSESKHFRRLSSEDSAYIQLEKEIVNRAQGVFLWVSLVVKTLLDGMRNSDTIADLQHELDGLPDSLEKYFKRIIQSIEPRYRISAAKSLQVTNQALEPLNLITHYFLDDPTLKSKQFIWTSLSATEVDRYHEDARRRLTARCRGLLDIIEADDPLLWPSAVCFKYSVHYLHRTVRDFLQESSEMQAFFAQLLPSGYVAERELCKAFLRLMSDMPLCSCGCDMDVRFDTAHQGLAPRPFNAVLKTFLTYARHMWKTHGDPMIGILQEAERIVFHRPKQWRRAKPTAFVGLAVQYGLTEFVRLRIEERPKLLHAKSIPLLYYALTTVRIGFANEYFGRVTFPFELNIRVDMIELLLRSGAQVEQRIWKPLVLRIHEDTTNEEPPGNVRGRTIGNVPTQDLVTVLAMMVEYGANLNENITLGFEIKQAQDTGRASDLNKAQFEVGHTETALDILNKRFTPAEVETILRHRPTEKKEKKSGWLWLAT